MPRKMLAILVFGVLVTATACGGNKTKTPEATSGGGLSVPSPASSGSTANTISVQLGETDATHMFMHLSAATAKAGSVTFDVSNTGQRTHEFVIMKTDTMAASIPIAGFEGKADRIDEDKAGTNEGETGDLEAGKSKTLTVDLKAGHYALVCNLEHHYAMGMRQDFTVS